ncbi:hypothetical protein [Ectobacillus ponti]|uniref:Uncharacterized protein n=1 Tax=Ectobacillus ponti TaxID=2961894 RepID=A0AA41X5Y6_9BACI|nr:hypothetical protein [Ectobacillus ponti]MCP8966923.1 hypothetical protein [Ectobacillus ponti]
MNRKWLYIFLALLLTSGVSAFVYYFTAKAADPPPQAERTVLVNEGKNISEDVHTYHEKLNQYVCYGRADEWSSSEKWKKYAADLTALQHTFQAHAAEAKDGKLKQDLLRAAGFAEQALRTENVKQLITLHRLLHDLDILLNSYPDQLWHVTYLENKQK